MRTLLLSAALLFVDTASANVSSIYAFVDLQPFLGKYLKLERNGVLYQPYSGVAKLEFLDPRRRGEIKRILEDPNFFPSKESYADFWTISTLQVSQQKSVSETALCDWNTSKTIAICIVECDGGRFELRADRKHHGNLPYLLRTISFRIAADEPDCNAEGLAYDLKSTGTGSVSLPLAYGK